MLKALSLALFLLSLALLFVGSVELPITQVLNICSELLLPNSEQSTPTSLALVSGTMTSETVRFIVLDHRLPQLLTALAAGAALGIGGAILQRLFRNPLADPSLLGINAGASLAVALVLLGMGAISGIAARGWLGLTAQVGAAFVGSMGVLLTLGVAARSLRSSTALLVLGVMLSCLSASGVLLLEHFSPSHEQLRGFLLWGMGSFSQISRSQLLFFLPAIFLPIAAVSYFCAPLDALLLGENYATSLGFHIRSTRLSLLLIVGWLTAVVTAFCGPISFIGLAAPHIATRLVRSSLHARLLPAAALVGALLAQLCVGLSQLPTEGRLLPLAAITPLIGAPIVIALLLRHNA